MLIIVCILQIERFWDYNGCEPFIIIPSLIHYPSKAFTKTRRIDAIGVSALHLHELIQQCLLYQNLCSASIASSAQFHVILGVLGRSYRRHPVCTLHSGWVRYI